MPRVRVTRTRRFRITDGVIIEDANDHWDAHVQAFAVHTPIDVTKLEPEPTLYETDDFEDLDPPFTVKTVEEHVVDLLKQGVWGEADALIFKYDLDMGQLYFLAGHYSEMEKRA